MKFYAVIDTNVLVSALLSSHNDAATVQVVSKVFLNDIIPLYSFDIIGEYNNVLRRKKFNFSEEAVYNLIHFIKEWGINVEPSDTGEILSDIKDLPFYEVVMEKQDENAYLITGNIKHFPKKVFIVTPREMIEIMRNK